MHEARVRDRSVAEDDFPQVRELGEKGKFVVEDSGIGGIGGGDLAPPVPHDRCSQLLKLYGRVDRSRGATQ